jgi:hypothetical protein
MSVHFFLDFIGEPVDKISPAFELRNSGVPAVARSFQLSLLPWVLTSGAQVFLGSAGHRVPLAGLHVPHHGRSPAAPYTHLKRHQWPLQSSNRRFGLVKSLPSQEKRPARCEMRLSSLLHRLSGGPRRKESRRYRSRLHWCSWLVVGVCIQEGLLFTE